MQKLKQVDKTTIKTNNFIYYAKIKTSRQNYYKN